MPGGPGELSKQKQGYDDFLLQNFTDAQKDYIIENLYPELTKALIHFVSEAKRCDQIQEDRPGFSKVA